MPPNTSRKFPIYTKQIYTNEIKANLFKQPNYAVSDIQSAKCSYLIYNERTEEIQNQSTTKSLMINTMTIYIEYLILQNVPCQNPGDNVEPVPLLSVKKFQIAIWIKKKKSNYGFIEPVEQWWNWCE